MSIKKLESKRGDGRGEGGVWKMGSDNLQQEKPPTCVLLV